VFDPFLGSGQVAVVSKINERRFCGFEIVTDYYKFAKKRIKSNMYRLKTS
jgi:site-specific DNA-methyltransferase (adenine-specific)